MPVMETSDMDLLREYARDNSEEAFRALVERHVNLVHAVALRQTANAHLAEDVTQAVFIVLAEKAASIPPKTILTGWLFRPTRFAAAAGLASSVATLAFLKQTSASTLPIVKGTLILMAQTKSKMLVIAGIVLLLGGTTVVVQQTLIRNSKANTPPNVASATTRAAE